MADHSRPLDLMKEKTSRQQACFLLIGWMNDMTDDERVVRVGS